MYEAAARSLSLGQAGAERESSINKELIEENQKENLLIAHSQTGGLQALLVE